MNDMPSTTTSTPGVFFTYVLESDKDQKKYVGFTKDLKERLKQHQKGLSFATSYRLPMRLIYFEACCDERDARRREHYLKTTGGRRFLAKRLQMYFKSKL